MSKFRLGMYIRGKYIEDNLIEFGGRNEASGFLAPDPMAYIKEIPMATPSAMSDLYELSFDDILDYLVNLGQRLHYTNNEYMNEARRASHLASPLTAPLVDQAYAMIPHFFERSRLKQMAEKPLGSIDYLDKWVPQKMNDGRIAHIRAFGARTVHIPAGNHPTPALLSIIRNALCRSDAVIKMPSNEPSLSLAVARTMGEMDPAHPLSKHLTVAYWKGGDTQFEEKLYRPHNVEKIVAWGGFAAMKHITQYIQPGLELVSLDPKRSGSIVGAEAFENEANLRDAAQRIAADIGSANQNGCVNARVIYCVSGTNHEDIDKLCTLGRYTYEALLALPSNISTKPKGGIKGELSEHIEALLLDDDFYDVYGGQNDEGAIIVSKDSQPVHFADLLNDRVGNLVPVDNADEIFKYFDAYTQSVGVYPDSLLKQLRDRMPLYGVQRIVALGYSGGAGINFAQPQDSIEILRRMLKWIVSEECPASIPPIWEGQGSDAIMGG